MLMRQRIRLIGSIATIGALLWTGTAMGGVSIDIMVPAYFFPGLDGNGNGQDDWQDMADAADSVGITAIMNPANGPGFGPNYSDTWQFSQYAAATTNLRNAGGLVIGYIFTQRGDRPVAELHQDIQDYINWYDVDGFFFDEMPTTFTMNTKTPAEQEVIFDYYTDLYNHIDQFDGHDYVIGNPGNHTEERFLNEPTADALVILENDFADQAVTDPPPTGAIGYFPEPWVTDPANGYDHTEFSLIQHNVPTTADMLAVVDAGLSKKFGQFYITDDTNVDDNPFNRLPTYWDDFVDKIEAVSPYGGTGGSSVPEPASATLFALGGLLALKRWR